MSEDFLDDATFVALREYVRQLTGIHFADGKRYLLESRVRRRAQACGMMTAHDYLGFVRGGDGGDERKILIADVTTNETSFYRHGRQMDILRSVLAEMLSVRRAEGRRTLSVWSAACSSGEEPYTLAMLLCDLLPDIDAWDVRILGTDLSSRQIAMARQADFSERQIRTLPDEFRRYIEATTPGQWRPVAAILRLVEFAEANLTEAPPATGAFDLVLCRNVLIYFDADIKRCALDRIEQSLRPGGLLLLGPSDSLHGLNSNFQRTPHSTYNLYALQSLDVDVRVPSEAARTSTPKAHSPPAAGALVRPSLRSRMLALRLDRGLQDVSRDLDTSVARALDRVIEVADVLNALGSEQGMDAGHRAALRRAARQMGQILFHLQVGDRGQQKVEALRAVLQEWLDELFADGDGQVDLGVQTSRFDPAIMPDPADAGAPEEDKDAAERPLSQDEIDALFD